MTSPRAVQRATVMAAMAKDKKRSKYKAVRCEVDGEKFDSKKEARRWAELKMLKKAGQVRNINRQLAFELIVNGERVGAYVSDFIYERLTASGSPKWEKVIEDCKGFRTPLYRLKKKLFEAQYGRKILET